MRCYDARMATHRKPSKAAIGRMAENAPHLLNPLVAFFVLGWRKVFLSVPPHGVDQTGTTRLLPDYVAMWGLNCCVSYLLEAPDHRDGANDVLSRWAVNTAYDLKL